MYELEDVALSLEMFHDLCQGANRTGIPPDFEHKIQAGYTQRFTRIFESDHDASFQKLQWGAGLSWTGLLRNLSAVEADSSREMSKNPWFVRKVIEKIIFYSKDRKSLTTLFRKHIEVQYPEILNLPDSGRRRL